MSATDTPTAAHELTPAPEQPVNPDVPAAVQSLFKATRHFDDRQLESIILMISVTNFFNRINTTLKVPAGPTWS
jgi:hypothetical protein